MKNMFKTFAVIYFVGALVVAVASAITYVIAVSRLIKVMDDENATIEILEKDVKNNSDDDQDNTY